jgi:hypothetical protein
VEESGFLGESIWGFLEAVEVLQSLVQGGMDLEVLLLGIGQSLWRGGDREKGRGSYLHCIWIHKGTRHTSLGSTLRAKEHCHNQPLRAYNWLYPQQLSQFSNRPDGFLL